MDYNTADFLRKLIKEYKDQGGIVSNALIEPGSPSETFKKRICTQIAIKCFNLDIRQNRVITAQKIGINYSTLSLITNYHFKNFSIEELQDILSRMLEL